jgi:hypothetical protein
VDTVAFVANIADMLAAAAAAVVVVVVDDVFSDIFVYVVFIVGVIFVNLLIDIIVVTMLM